MKIAIINKSDSTGGAAVVSRRLMDALRDAGADARMIVVEKLSDSPFVEVAASSLKIKSAFLSERLDIFCRNGFRRSSLFKIDTASCGLPLWKHPIVKDADAILLNWVNQGMLSLHGLKKLLRLGKPVIWTMHDMWCMTGICHHAGKCLGYESNCRECPLLYPQLADHRLAYTTFCRKLSSYKAGNINFVAVSSWLAEKASDSALLCGKKVHVIPNAFRFENCSKEGIFTDEIGKNKTEKIRILFGAARLDDPVKGFPTLIETTHMLRKKYPLIADSVELVTFGNIRNESLFSQISIPHHHLGMIHGEENIRDVYQNAEILVSTSEYETLPGTLVEAQAYGCIPVSFDRGGQRDIVDHLSTGWLSPRADDCNVDAASIAEGIVWAYKIAKNHDEFEKIKDNMRRNAMSKFSSEAVAEAYLNLISRISHTS